MGERLRSIIADARALAESGDNVRAAARYSQAAQKARDYQLPGELAYCLHHEAEALLENGQAQDALSVAEEAMALYLGKDAARGLNFANSARLVALAKEALGQAVEVKSLWAELRSIYELHGIKDAVSECDAHLAQ